MITELRQNLDVIVVIIGALIAYHLWKKMNGYPKGISK